MVDPDDPIFLQAVMILLLCGIMAAIVLTALFGK